ARGVDREDPDETEGERADEFGDQRAAEADGHERVLLWVTGVIHHLEPGAKNGRDKVTRRQGDTANNSEGVERNFAGNALDFVSLENIFRHRSYEWMKQSSFPGGVECREVHA